MCTLVTLSRFKEVLDHQLLVNGCGPVPQGSFAFILTGKLPDPTSCPSSSPASRGHSVSALWEDSEPSAILFTGVLSLAVASLEIEYPIVPLTDGSAAEGFLR